MKKSTIITSLYTCCFFSFLSGDLNQLFISIDSFNKNLTNLNTSLLSLGSEEAIRVIKDLYPNLTQQQHELLLNGIKKYIAREEITLAEFIEKIKTNMDLKRRLPWLVMAQEAGAKTEEGSGYLFFKPSQKRIEPNPADVMVAKLISELPHTNDTQKLQNIKATIALLYKIHIMPQDKDLLSVLSILLKQQQKGLIGTFKVIDRDNAVLKDKEGNYFPRIVIYTYGREATQKALNELYPSLKKYEGLRDEKNNIIIPRYNAPIQYATALYVAQGNADEKNVETYRNEYFEAPDFVYYKPNFEGLPEKDYKLRHPTTQQILN